MTFGKKFIIMYIQSKLFKIRFQTNKKYYFKTLAKHKDDHYLLGNTLVKKKSSINWDFLSAEPSQLKRIILNVVTIEFSAGIVKTSNPWF